MRPTPSLTRRLLSSVLESPTALRSAAAVVWRCPLRTLRSLFVLVASAVVATACGDSSDPAAPVDTLTIEDFVGSWSATSEVFTSNTDDQTFDLIAAGGENRFTMLSGGRTRTWLDLGDFSDEWDSLVTLNAAGDLLTSTPAEATRRTEQFTFSLDGNTLTLTNVNAVFDFTLSDAEGTSATMVAVFQKTN